MVHLGFGVLFPPYRGQTTQQNSSFRHESPVIYTVGTSDHMQLECNVVCDLHAPTRPQTYYKTHKMAASDVVFLSSSLLSPSHLFVFLVFPLHSSILQCPSLSLFPPHSLFHLLCIYSISVSLALWLSLSLSLSFSFPLSIIYLSVCLFLSVSLSIYLSLSFFLSLSLSLSLYISLSLCLSLSL